jgi:hypothetical protein
MLSISANQKLTKSKAKMFTEANKDKKSKKFNETKNVISSYCRRVLLILIDRFLLLFYIKERKKNVSEVS